MNKQQQKAKEHAEILLAFSRGETMEYRTTKDVSGEWFPVWDGHALDSGKFDYRLTKKPVEAWVFLYASGQLGGTTWNTKDGAERHHIANGCAGKAILMREVTE